MAFRKNTKKNSFNLVLSISVPGFTLKSFISPNEIKLILNSGGKKSESKKQIIVKEQKNRSSVENH